MAAMTSEERAAKLLERGVTTRDRVAAAIREAEEEARQAALQVAYEIAKGSPDPAVAEAIAALRHLLK